MRVHHAEALEYRVHKPAARYLPVESTLEYIKNVHFLVVYHFSVIYTGRFLVKFPFQRAMIRPQRTFCFKDMANHV